MAKQRIVNTKFWDDSYVVGLIATEKLLFLYLLTNPLTNIAGVYELPLKRAAFDVGIKESEVQKAFDKFERDGRIVRDGGWIGVVNFVRHQTLNPKVRQGIAAELEKAPKAIVDSLSIDYQGLKIPYRGLSHLNLNSNRNSENSSIGQLSTEFSTAMKEGKESLLKKWKIS